MSGPSDNTSAVPYYIGPYPSVDDDTIWLHNTRFIAKILPASIHSIAVTSRTKALMKLADPLVDDGVIAYIGNMNNRDKLFGHIIVSTYFRTGGWNLQAGLAEYAKEYLARFETSHAPILSEICSVARVRLDSNISEGTPTQSVPPVTSIRWTSTRDKPGVIHDYAAQMKAASQRVSAAKRSNSDFEHTMLTRSALRLVQSGRAQNALQDDAMMADMYSA